MLPAFPKKFFSSSIAITLLLMRNPWAKVSIPSSPIALCWRHMCSMPAMSGRRFPRIAAPSLPRLLLFKASTFRVALFCKLLARAVNPESPGKFLLRRSSRKFLLDAMEFAISSMPSSPMLFEVRLNQVKWQEGFFRLCARLFAPTSSMLLWHMSSTSKAESLTALANCIAPADPKLVSYRINSFTYGTASAREAAPIDPTMFSARTKRRRRDECGSASARSCTPSSSIPQLRKSKASNLHMLCLRSAEKSFAPSLPM
mmetsp:Transcript_78133/g.123321  ORF Transcript_78133/g.123321 Transcript_78133/m.123321 type:complete len:258 (-) Transcript_78133:297-1070(-)